MTMNMGGPRTYDFGIDLSGCGLEPEIDSLGHDICMYNMAYVDDDHTPEEEADATCCAHAHAYSMKVIPSAS